VNEQSPINAATIAEAERLLGVDYSDAERLQMLDNIAGQIELAIKRRALRLPQGLAPATRFDPRLPGWKAIDPGIFRPGDGPPPPLPARDIDIAFAPVTHLARWIRGGELTSLRLTEIYLERIARLGEELKCIAVATPELAREQARRADRLLADGIYLGPLHGIPWGAKDLLDTAGIATGWGAEPYRGRIPERDAAVVKKITEAGAVLIAKTTLGALAYGDIWYEGRTRNPWNPARNSGGSSAGSAATVGSGAVPIALGSDAGGSIRIPASFCGVVGLKPTLGAIPVWPGTVNENLSHAGPLTRSADDARAVLRLTRGFDPRDPQSAYPAPHRDDAVDALIAAPDPELPDARPGQPGRLRRRRPGCIPVSAPSRMVT